MSKQEEEKEPITVEQLRKLRHENREQFLAALRRLVREAKNEHTRSIWKQMLRMEGEDPNAP